MPNRIIVVLANSIKHHQHCVAGKCINTGEWIRPVANASGAALSHEQVQYENPYGRYTVKPKQKIEIGLSHSAPLHHQPDNFIINDFVWQQNFSINNEELQLYLDTPVDLWGRSNYVQYAAIVNNLIAIEQSLYLIKVDNLNLYVNKWEKRRAEFTYLNISYDFAVTDPNFDSILAQDKVTNGVLCISLAEEFEGKCYKLVATVFLQDE